MKQDDQLLIDSRQEDMSPYFPTFDLTNECHLKCIANTLKLFGSDTFLANEMDIDIIRQLNSPHTFIIYRIILLMTVNKPSNLPQYATTIIQNASSHFHKDHDTVNEVLKALHCVLCHTDLNALDMDIFSLYQSILSLIHI